MKSLKFVIPLLLLSLSLFAQTQPNAGTPKLIFYGGDVNPSDPNVECFDNGNSLFAPLETVWGEVRVPAPHQVEITGVLFNVTADVSAGTIFDPMTATYQVRAGLRKDVGGQVVAQGSVPLTVTATGRTPCGFTEYKAVAMFLTAVPMSNRQPLWFNLSPQCTDTGNSNCSAVQFYVENTTQETNGINKGLQPAGQIFYNDPNTNWSDFCDPAVFNFNAQQCARLSFGLYGFPQ